jgi:DNA-binding NarL/FixJ family response regulator
VLVASDQTIVRESLVQLLNAHSAFSAESCDVKQQARATRQPDIVLQLASGAAGLQAQLERVKASCPGAKLLVLLLTDDDSAAVVALRCGVNGILDPDVEITDLREHLRQVASGEFAISDKLARRLARLHGTLNPNTSPRSLKEADLTPRELDVLRLLAQGATNRDIATSLTLSEHTVRAHMRGIMQKLHVSNRVQAASLAWQGMVNGKS